MLKCLTKYNLIETNNVLKEQSSGIYTRHTTRFPDWGIGDEEEYMEGFFRT